MSQIEIHPHIPFVPKNTTVLILGSFPGKDNSNVEGKDEWFYASKRNQFWNIIRGVYNEQLISTQEKKAFFEKKGIALTDLFLKIKRKETNNSDSSLEILEDNSIAIKKILDKYRLKSVFFTSQFVEKEFRKLFPTVIMGECLPSPSPRYARMSLMEKIEFYKKKLPQ
jgi:hypoxanthine-DNA glycosylase